MLQFTVVVASRESVEGARITDGTDSQIIRVRKGPEGILTAKAFSTGEIPTTKSVLAEVGVDTNEEVPCASLPASRLLP